MADSANNANGFTLIYKGGKRGFITDEGQVCNPKFDNIDVIEMGEPVRVRLGDQWGCVKTDNEFVTEEQQEEEKYDIYYEGVSK